MTGRELLSDAVSSGPNRHERKPKDRQLQQACRRSDCSRGASGGGESSVMLAAIVLPSAWQSVVQRRGGRRFAPVHARVGRRSCGRPPLHWLPPRTDPGRQR